MRLLFLPGDGIGPEITAATEQVVTRAAHLTGLPVQVDVLEIGFQALDRSGTTLPDSVLDAAYRAHGVILGPVSHADYPPVAQGGVNPSGKLRKTLELYANIRPALSHAAVPTPTGKPIDVVVVRENLEGFYADRNMVEGPGEMMPEPGIALALRKITAKGSARIARAAFELAKRRPNGRVCAVHKANVMRLSCGLFLEECRKMADLYPDIPYEEVLVDSAAALLVRTPDRFDVIVTTNMFGDILSDLAAELSGGLGLAASLNHGENHALAQAQHGSAPDIAGRDLANPSSLIGSAVMLMEHLGATSAARLIRHGLETALATPETRTRDLGGTLGTQAFTKAVITAMEQAEIS